MPVIGFLHGGSADATNGPLVKPFRDGLAQFGYIEGHNLRFVRPTGIGFPPRDDANIARTGGLGQRQRVTPSLAIQQPRNEHVLM
jgi:hypothetical protein